MKPGHLVKKLSMAQIITNEKGIFLITSLMMVAILGMLSTIIVMAINIDVKISGNYRTGIKANYAAEAGIDEIRARLFDSSDYDFVGDTKPSGDFEKKWAVYILTDTDFQAADFPTHNPDEYNYYIPISGTPGPPAISSSPLNAVTNVVANSLQSDIKYYARVKHKREYDAEEDGHSTNTIHYIDNDGGIGTHTASGDPGYMVFYGYGDPDNPTNLVQYSTSTTLRETTDYPVEIISVMGMSGGSTGFVEVEVVHGVSLPILGAMYSEGDTDVHGKWVTVDGADGCTGNEVPAAYNLLPSVFVEDVGTTTKHPYIGPSVATGTNDLDIEGYIETMKDDADVIIPGGNHSNQTYGSDSNYVICYAEADIGINNVTGYGILLVDGDLSMSGNTEWNGIIVVSGAFTYSGAGASGASGINGALMANSVSLNGNVTITYDSCEVSKSVSSHPLDVINWQRFIE